MTLVALVALSGACARPPCSPESRQALLAIARAASHDVISSGQCDGYQRVEQCPAYALIEANFVTTEGELCRR